MYIVFWTRVPCFFFFHRLNDWIFPVLFATVRAPVITQDSCISIHLRVSIYNIRAEINQTQLPEK